MPEAAQTLAKHSNYGGKQVSVQPEGFSGCWRLRGRTRFGPDNRGGAAATNLPVFASYGFCPKARWKPAMSARSKSRSRSKSKGM